MAVELRASYGGSSTKMMKAIVVAALRAGGDDGERYAKDVEAEKNWRFQYPTHFRRFGNLMGSKSGVSVAEAALDAAHEAFTIDEKPLSEIDTASGDDFKPLTITGDGEVQPVALTYKGKLYTGEEIVPLLSKLAEEGKIEPSGLSSVSSVLPLLGNSLRDKWFLLLGAGSELGPCSFLLQRGAHVVALRTKKRAAWAQLAEEAKRWPGVLILPTEDGTIDTAGCDLIQEPQRVLRWLQSVVPPSVDLTVGFYIYIDGVRHVHATVIGDLIISSFQKSHQARVAFLASPAVSCPVSHEIVASMQEYRDNAPWYARFSGCPPPDTDLINEKLYMRHEYNVRQGPNYAMAKMLQNCRAMLSPKVSYQIAPACFTESVVHNRTMERGLKGVAYLPPLEAFDPKVTATLCGILLLSHVLLPAVKASHPLESLEGQFHGGWLRNGFAIDNTNILSALVYALGSVAPKV